MVTDKMIEAAARAIYELQPEMLKIGRNWHSETAFTDLYDITPFDEACNKDNAIEKAKAALEAAEAVRGDGWLPIESAPHETLVIVGWHDKTFDEWSCEVAMASFGKRVGAYSSRSFHGSATHWMPLPQPPAKEA